MKRMRMLLLSALVLSASLWSALAAETSTVLGILEIRGLEKLATDAFELSKVAGQPMPREMVSMVLYSALGTMPGMGIEPNGKVRALWLDNGTDEGTLALLLPVENNGADYLASLGQSGWENAEETPEGLLHFVAPADSSMAWKDVYFLKRGSTLVAAPGVADAQKADSVLASLPPILPVEGDVAVQIRPAALMELLSPKIQEQLDTALASNGDVPPETAEIGRLYANAYMSIAKQLDEFTLGLGIADGHLNLHSRTAPVADTLLARWFATLRTPSAAAAAVNLPGALFVDTFHMGDASLLAPAYFQWMEAMMKLMPQETGADFMASYLNDAKGYWEQMGGDFAIALFPPTKENPIRLAEYVALKDSAILRSLTQTMVKNVNEMFATMISGEEDVPVQFELVTGEPREYRGVSVDRITYRLTPKEELKASWPEGMPTELAVEMAWVPGGVLAMVGDASLTDQLVDRVLDGTVTPVSSLPSWKAFFPTPEPGLLDLSHFALFDTIRSYVQIYGGDEMAASIPAGPGNLDSHSYLAFGGIMSRIRFSLADIGAIIQKAQEAQQKAMEAQMQMMQQMESDGEYDDMPMEEDVYIEEEVDVEVEEVETTPPTEADAAE